MKRDARLAPLSRDHHRAIAQVDDETLAVLSRLHQGTDLDLLDELRHRDALNQKRALREAEELQVAEKKAGRIKKARIKLELNTGAGGKAFGSITTMDILTAMAEFDKKLADIDRHDILLDKPIKHTGDFEIPIKLHPDVTAILKVKVTASTDQGTDDEGPDEEGDE